MDSAYSRYIQAWLSLVELPYYRADNGWEVHSVAPLALLYHKEQAQGTQAPLITTKPGCISP